MIGPGKYGDLAEALAYAVQAQGVVLLVINGQSGSGLNFATRDAKLLAELPGMLRGLADAMEKTGESAQDVADGQKLEKQGEG